MKPEDKNRNLHYFLPTMLLFGPWKEEASVLEGQLALGFILGKKAR